MLESRPSSPSGSDAYTHEPERYWLYFCLFNYRAKGDLDAAREDLLRFLGAADAAVFRRQMHAAGKWVAEINDLIGPRSSERLAQDA